MAKKVRALRDGFYGGVRRRAGSVFNIADGHKPGRWMEEIREAKPAAKPVEAPKPAAAKAAKGDEVI